MKEMLKAMKSTLISQTQGQIGNLKEANCEELGAAIDMIKDLEETLYYCTIIEAMEKKDEEKPAEKNYYYTEQRYIPMYDDPVYYRDMDKQYGRMYYNGGNGSSNGGNSGSSMSGNGMGTSHYGGRMSAYEHPVELRDFREGRSPLSRKQYMESKELHQDKAKQLRDLEKYMQELTTDIAEMIEDSTPEEKQLLQRKISSLATKIDQLK